MDDEDIKLSDEEEKSTDFESFLDGSARYRPEVLTKGSGLNILSKIQDLKEFFSKCSCNKNEDDESSMDSSEREPPPKRYIYWGPAYDIENNAEHENKKTARLPHLENEQTNLMGSKFVTNYVSTTKYSPITFLPLNLFEQFRKKANLYFLVIAILAFTELSPKSPVFSVAPLVFVLAVSAVKEAYEDYKRYEMDKEINNRLVDVCRPNPEGIGWCFKKLAWDQVQIGDVIRVTKETRAFPADILLLQSSTNQGLCNIETANLDGETNLKIKQAVGATYSLPTDEDGDDYPFNKQLQFKLESEVCTSVYAYICHLCVCVCVCEYAI